MHLLQSIRRVLGCSLFSAAAEQAAGSSPGSPCQQCATAMGCHRASTTACPESPHGSVECRFLGTQHHSVAVAVIFWRDRKPLAVAAADSGSAELWAGVFVHILGCKPHQCLVSSSFELLDEVLVLQPQRVCSAVCSGESLRGLGLELVCRGLLATTCYHCACRCDAPALLCVLPAPLSQ
jgi:hypothetical protein